MLPRRECATTTGAVRTLQSQELGEPAVERGLIEPGRGSGLAEARRVRDHDPMVFHEAGNHRRPVRAPAFDTAVEQYERRAATAFEHRGGDPMDVDAALS